MAVWSTCEKRFCWDIRNKRWDLTLFSAHFFCVCVCRQFTVYFYEYVSTGKEKKEESLAHNRFSVCAYVWLFALCVWCSFCAEQRTACELSSANGLNLYGSFHGVNLTSKQHLSLGFLGNFSFQIFRAHTRQRLSNQQHIWICEQFYFCSQNGKKTDEYLMKMTQYFFWTTQTNMGSKLFETIFHVLSSRQNMLYIDQLFFPL